MDWKHVATLPEKEQMRAWVENWKRIGPELARLKKEELRAMNEKEAMERLRRVMDSRVLPLWTDPAQHTSSGLIEQQRLFQKARSAAR